MIHPHSESIEPVSILLVDDDPGTLETLVDIFDDMGYHVDTAASGKQALARIQERAYDLALLDIRLPDIPGTELLKAVKDAHPATVCMMATGEASKESAVSALNIGASAYLEKPIDIPDVKAKVRSALEQQRLEAENAALREITDAGLSTLELDELLVELLESLVKAHAADRGVIYLKDPNSGLLTERAIYYAATGPYRGILSDEPVSPHDGIVGQAMRHEEMIPAIGVDLEGDPIAADGVKAAIAAPLSSRNRLIGVLRLDRLTPRSFTSHQFNLLRVLSSRAAVLIDNARLYDAERHLARTLAESFLSRTPERDDLGIASRYEPASVVAQIGGDYFDFIELDGRWLGIVVGDVCGKGIAAAIYTGKAKDMLRAYALEDVENAHEAGTAPSPQWVITRLNRALSSQMSEECMFVTMVYGVLDLETGNFTYTNAAHPPPILHQPVSGRFLELGTTGGMVGAMEDMEFAEDTVQLEPGSVIAMFTDGVTESRTGQEMLENAGVQEVIQQHAGASAEEIAAAIYSRALEFGGGVLRDDVAIVVVKNERSRPEA